MMDFSRITAYLKYLRRARTEYGVHSPFVFNLLKNCIYDKKFYPQYDIIKQYRKELLSDKRILNIKDLGADSKHFTSNDRKIKDMAERAGSSWKEMKLWFRLAAYFKPAHILELGTHLGLSTLAWRLGSEGEITTVEGSEDLQLVAREKLQKYTTKKINFVRSDFDEFFEQNRDKWDLVFVDGNHTYEATIRYFDILKSRTYNHSLIVFHDIHWSKGMERAWAKIIADPDVHVSIDLFCCGLVFFRKEQFKEHFVIRF